MSPIIIARQHLLRIQRLFSRQTEYDPNRCIPGL